MKDLEILAPRDSVAERALSSAARRRVISGKEGQALNL
jgi:hypothetical protein